MISKLAIEDIEEITKQGGTVSPRDVIRLNALGLKITDDPNYELATLPRCASLNGILFKQPNIEQDMFLDDAARIYNADNSTILALEAYVLAHDEVKWKNLRHPKIFAIKVGAWVKVNLGKVTAQQLRRALDFCLYGVDPDSGEMPVLMADEKEKLKSGIGTDKSWALSKYLHATSIGIDSVSALRATSPQLSAMIERAYMLNKVPLSDDEKEATAEYYMTLDYVKKRAFPKKEDEEKQVTANG